MEQVVRRENATAAWLAVKRNGGAPGIDGMTTQQLRDHVRKHWETIRSQAAGRDVCAQPGAAGGNPQAQRRDTAAGHPDGARPMDTANAFAGAATRSSTPPSAPTATASDRDEVRTTRCAQRRDYVQAGKDWVVDMDITKFFDHVNHDILMNRIGQTIRDKRVLRLIGKLSASRSDGRRSGAGERGRHAPRRAALAAAGQHLPGRAGPGTGRARAGVLPVCRRLQHLREQSRAAERVLESITAWISKHLRLEVNATKSGVGRPWERKFLGFRINPEGKIEAAPQECGAVRARKSGSCGEAARV